MEHNREHQISGFYDIFIKIKTDRESTFGFFSPGPPSALPPGEPVTKTFAEIHQDIQTCYNNLVKLGFTDTSVVGLNITNSYYFFVCDFACILLGVQTVLHSKNDPVELLKQRLDQFRIKDLIGEKPVPGLENTCRIIELHRLFDRAAAQVQVKKRPLASGDISVVFSSGTSGLPKGLGASERGSVETGKCFFQWMGFNNRDKFLVYLPLASYQQRFLMWSCLINNVHIILVDEKTLFKALQVFKPTILLAPPNFYFNLYRMNTGSGWKQWLRRRLPYKNRSRLRRWIARKYTYRPLYETLGGSTRCLITGMAPIDFKILEHFHQAYLDIFQIYGQTEIGMIAGNKPGANKLGTVGKPIIPLYLSQEDNEVITNSDFPTINSYYLEDRQRQELGKRIPTGDIGAIDEDGYLTIKGRKNETLILKSGIKINPALIENKIKSKLGNIEEVLIFKPDDERIKTDLNVVVLVKSNSIEIDRVKEVIGSEHEIKQSSEKVGLFTYRIKKDDRSMMYTENNKFSRVRTIHHLNKNHQELKRIN
ncbi:MAG: AMP-binding protein [Candidatus Aminicenantes bacterium]|jgi:long-subunit acyl-CoA synthetase (AMP-forming)